MQLHLASLSVVLTRIELSANSEEEKARRAQSQEASPARLEAVIRGWTSISFHAPRTALCAVTQCFPVLCIKADV